MRRRRSGVIGLVLLAGCHFPVVISNQVESSPHAVGCAGADCGDSAHSISVTYLGVSGLLIQHDGHVVLTAPFFSNPSFAMVRPRLIRLLRSSPRISADTAAIEKLLPRSADRSSAILVGHGHYDHLMDVPYIARKRATAATIYSGPTVRHMLMGDSALRAASASRLVSIPTIDAGTRDVRGVWYYTSDSAYRFMALVASHAPLYRALRKNYTFTAGTIAVDLDSLPRTAAEWKLGEPYSYIIDVLSAARVPVFRIYFQDAPSEPPLGFPPSDILAERGVDLAVLCAATSSNVSRTPDSLVKVLMPSAVLITHWEDFFRSQSLPIQLGIATDFEAFKTSLKNSLPRSSGWVMPLPQTTLRFREVVER